MARLRNAGAATATATAQPSAATTALAARRALREKTNTTRTSAVADRIESSKSDDLVKDAKPTRARGRRQGPAQQDEDPYLMTGGLGPAAAEVDTPVDEDAQAQEARAQDSDNIAVATKPARRPARTARKIVQSAADKQVLEEIRRRMEATAKGQQVAGTGAPVVPAMVESTQNAREPQSPDATKITAFKRNTSAQPSKRSSMLQPPSSVLRLQNTPALESSLLALKNFRRRPRQPSMLQMVKQRTASARQSAVQATDVDDSNLSGLDLDLYASDDDDVDDFAPDAEGTPLNVMRTHHRASSVSSDRPQSKIESIRRSSGRNKRKSDEIAQLEASVLSSQPKRRKATRSNDTDAAPQENETIVDSLPASPAQEDVPGDELEVLVVNSATSSQVSSPLSEMSSPAPVSARLQDELIPSTEEALQRKPDSPMQADEPVDVTDDESHNGTFAEPASSSPAPQPHNTSQQTNYLADPLSQFSPPPAKKTRNQKIHTIKTADLKSLLPRRRKPMEPHRRRGEYSFGEFSEIEEPEVSFDGEESFHAPGRSKSARTAAATTKKSKNSTATKKTSAPASRKTQDSATRKSARTYGRGSNQSDKENADEDHESDAEEGDDTLDTSITMVEAAQGKELDDARRKFAEVDQWDMEFESMSVEDHRSSSQGWR